MRSKHGTARSSPKKKDLLTVCHYDDDDFERNEDDDEISRIPIFTCPAHHCWTCTQKDMIKLEKEEAKQSRQKDNNKIKTKKASRKKRKRTQSIFRQKKSVRLYRCLYCPVAYHATCIPPNSRFHELAVLCHEHSLTNKLPDLDIDNSIQKQIEDKVEKTLLRLHGFNRANNEQRNSLFGARRGKSANPFFPGLRGDRFDSTEMDLISLIKDEITLSVEGQDRRVLNLKPSSTASMVLYGSLPFMCPVDIKNEVYSKPPSYTHIHSNKVTDPNNRPKKISIDHDKVKCTCTKICGEDCFNRLTMAECFEGNCKLGKVDCGNRELSKRRFVKCQPSRERGKGWGLLTLVDVPRGKLVQEYVGEIIDEKEKERRLSSWNADHSFYVMALSRGYYVDAREFANYSRFINHSCSPNCKVVSISVKGLIRNGIYSIREIKKGEFLSYDYHFDSKQNDRFVCRCGAPNCRGTMMDKFTKGITDENKIVTWKEAKTLYNSDKSFLEKIAGTNVVSIENNSLLPGTDDPTETLVKGPLIKHRDIAIHSRLFLWRNVKVGSNFASRSNRLRKLVSNRRLFKL